MALISSTFLFILNFYLFVHLRVDVLAATASVVQISLVSRLIVSTFSTSVCTYFLEGVYSLLYSFVCNFEERPHVSVIHCVDSVDLRSP